MDKTLNRARLLELFKTLPPDVQEDLNPMLNYIEFVYGEGDDLTLQWQVRIQKGKWLWRHLEALSRLFDIIRNEPAPV